MPKRPAADDQNARNDPHVKESHGNQGLYWNALVFFSARVLSHCGFILSLFAIWLAWLIPTALLQYPAVPGIKKLKSRTRPPRPPAFPPDTSTNLAPILAPNGSGTQPTRRVYFADTGPDAINMKLTMEVTPPAQVADDAPALQSRTPSQTAEASPQLSVNMLSPDNATGPSESLDSLALDSDSSSRPSSFKRSSKLTKFKLGFRSSSVDVTANAGSVLADEAAGSPLGISTFLQKNQRSSVPNSGPVKRSPSRFSFRRCSLPVERVTRTPKPIPRTMPYGAPYFATPPILLDDHYSTDLNNRLQLKDELANSGAPESDSELSRGRAIRRVPLAQSEITFLKQVQ